MTAKESYLYLLCISSSVVNECFFIFSCLYVITRVILDNNICFPLFPFVVSFLFFQAAEAFLVRLFEDSYHSFHFCIFLLFCPILCHRFYLNFEICPVLYDSTVHACYVRCHKVSLIPTPQLDISNSVKD